METAARYAQNARHGLDRENGLVRGHQFEDLDEPSSSLANQALPLSSDHVWMAPARQGVRDLPASGRLRPCIRRLRYCVRAARLEMRPRETGPNQWPALKRRSGPNGASSSVVRQFAIIPLCTSPSCRTGSGPHPILSAGRSPISLAGLEQSPNRPRRTIGQRDGDQLHGLALHHPIAPEARFQRDASHRLPACAVAP